MKINLDRAREVLEVCGYECPELSPRPLKRISMSSPTVIRARTVTGSRSFRHGFLPIGLRPRSTRADAACVTKSSQVSQRTRSLRNHDLFLL